MTVNTAVEPSNTNDVVLWKSDDDSIATVYRGLIQGSKIGTTYVTAFSQSGSCTAEIIAAGCGTATITAVADNGVSEVFEITVKDYPFSNIEPVINSGVLTGVKAAVNYIPDYETITVIAAVYSSDGTLSAAEQKDVSVSDITDGTLTADGFNLNVSDGDTVKAFIWNDVYDIIPLGK